MADVRLIDAKALLEKECCGRISGEDVRNAPTINPEDCRPRGRWKDVQETEMYVPGMKFTITETAETCSECKARIGFVGAKQYLFDAICPNCGAKMEGK